MTRGTRFAAAVLCWAAVCGAQQGPARVRIPVWLDGAGPAAASDFRASIGGAASGVLGVKGPGDDLLLILALDITQDLTQATLAKEALSAEIRGLPARTVVTVVRAQDSLKVLAAPQTGREAAVEAVQSLNISGKAGLLDTVEFLGRTGDAVLARSAVRAAVLYVTDSDIQNYRENFTNPSVNSSDTRDLSRKFPQTLIQERITKLSARLARQQTPLFVVHLVYRADQMNQAYQSGLQELAELTAGRIVFCRSAAEVSGAVRQTMDAIENHYSLTLALPPGARNPLEVQIASAGAKVAVYRTRLSRGK
jgi:hypothetical protein